jgi:hypothetical protein
VATEPDDGAKDGGYPVQMMDDLAEGDLVEYAGPPREGPDWPRPREWGRILSLDPPGEWVADWERAGTAVFVERHLRKIAENREVDKS